jgi:hypothetical protein
MDMIKYHVQKMNKAILLDYGLIKHYLKKLSPVSGLITISFLVHFLKPPK